MTFTKYACCIGVAGLTCLFSCTKDKDNTEGLKSLIKIERLAPGTKCPYGGINVNSGIDVNRNNTLDAAEVDHEQPVCNGGSAEVDKQIIFQFGTVTVANARYNIVMQLPEFNITDYPGVDSVKLMASVYAYPTGSSSSDFPPVAILELFNITDSLPLQNSRILSDRQAPGPLMSSRNVRASFPEKTISLGLKISSRYPGDNAIGANVFMIMYRR